MVWQKLCNELIWQHTHLDLEEFLITLNCDVKIINKFIKGDD